MIGTDYYYYSFVFGEVSKGKVNEPVTINSLFGLILSGRFDNSTSVDLNSTHVLRIHTETMSENIFTDELDSCIKHVFPSHQRQPFGHYSTKLQLKEFYNFLPDNYQLSKDTIA